MPLYHLTVEMVTAKGMDMSKRLGQHSPSNLRVHTRRDSFRVPPNYRLQVPILPSNRGKGMYMYCTLGNRGVRDPRLARRQKASESTDQSARTTDGQVSGKRNITLLLSGGDGILLAGQADVFLTTHDSRVTSHPWPYISTLRHSVHRRQL